MCRACESFPVLDWLAEKGYRLRPAPAYVLRYLFEHADVLSDVAQWCDETRISHSAIRFMLRKKGLPVATHWVTVARLLHYRKKVADSGVSLRRVAWRLGYGDHSSLHHAFRRAFDLTPREAVACTDLELMERWWARVMERKKVAA